MKQSKIIIMGVLTYFMLGLFNWIQNGQLLFSYPIVPALILVMLISLYVLEKPKLTFTTVLLSVFVVLHFFFSPFFLEIVGSFEQQMKWQQSGLLHVMEIISFIILTLGVHSHVHFKGKRPLNLGIGIVFAGIAYLHLMNTSLIMTQALLAFMGLFGALIGLLTNKKDISFDSLMLLGIGLLYLISCVNWILM